MHPSVKKALQGLVIVFSSVFVVMVIAMILVYYTEQEIEKTVQNKIDRATIQQPIKIYKYDSLTQAKLDTIEVRRSISHRHVDNLYDGELQSVLDSMYNGR